jgi:hypothetical protein
MHTPEYILQKSIYIITPSLSFPSIPPAISVTQMIFLFDRAGQELLLRRPCQHIALFNLIASQCSSCLISGSAVQSIEPHIACHNPAQPIRNHISSNVALPSCSRTKSASLNSSLGRPPLLSSVKYSTIDLRRSVKLFRNSLTRFVAPHLP